MRQLFASCLFLLFSLGGTYSSAQFVAEVNPDFTDTIRVQYRGSQSLPDGIAFLNMVRLVNGMSKNDADAPVEYLQVKMGLTTDRAHDLAGQMLEANRNLNAEIAEFQRKATCDMQVSVVTDDAIYESFDSFDDASETIAAEHLHLLKSEIGAEMSARLQQLLDIEKANMGYIKLDHKKYYMKKGINPFSKFSDLSSELCMNGN